MSMANLFDTTVTEKEKNLNLAYSISTEPFSLGSLDKHGWIINNNNLYTDNIVALKNSKNEIIAVINSYEADRSSLLLQHNSKEQLSNCWFIDSLWVSTNISVSEAAPLALYVAIKAARIYNKDVVITIKNSQNNFPSMSYLKAEIIKDFGNDEILIGQRVEYIMLSLSEQLIGNSQDFVSNEFVQDMYKMFFHWYDQFNKSTWCNAILNHTLTRRQYISTLYNLHSYVQYTTRLCARAIAFSDDLFLRNNYIDHFRGEINHEILIQKDLAQLGEDVEYLKKYYIPNIKTKAFMTLQESTIGFYQDPVLLLACPFVAEGVSANFKIELLDNLEKIIGKWGIPEPEKAMRFLNSHVKFDGGDDGHWEGVMQILPKYITTEYDRQRFISIAKFGMDSILNSFDSNVEENLIW